MTKLNDQDSYSPQSGLYEYRNVYYKYKRNSTSKFIDIDIQNADECFLDTEPLEKTECVSDACYISYEIREGLSPLSSCSGNALDMSTLDTDTTECTETTFVVAASKAGQDKLQRVFTNTVQQIKTIVTLEKEQQLVTNAL